MSRAKHEAHLRYIRSLPCCICGDNTATEAAHVRMTDRRVGKINPGMGQKPDDSWTVPLCGHHHRDQHLIEEAEFWGTFQIDPIFLALALWQATGDHETGCRIIACQKEMV